MATITLVFPGTIPDSLKPALSATFSNHAAF